MQLLLNIKNNTKATLLAEFLKSLNYVSSVEEINDAPIPPTHQKLVLNRIKNTKPQEYIAYTDARKKLKKKYGF